MSAKTSGPLDIGWQGYLGIILGFFAAVLVFWLGTNEARTPGDKGALIIGCFIIWVFASGTIAWLLTKFSNESTVAVR